MSTRKERKQEAVARVAAEKAAKRERRAELKAMSPEARQVAKAADRAAAREAKQAAKAERKLRKSSMTRAERREARKRERVYRKVSHRPRRIVGWSVVAVAIIGIGALVAPIVGNVSRLLSIEVDSTTAEGVAAREYGNELAGDISDEGIVLLENSGGVLPLAEKSVNVFSFASFNLRYGGGGSGGADQSTAVTLYDALEQQGIAYNTELYAAMEEAGAGTDAGSGNGLIQILSMLGGAGAEEPAPDYLTDDVMAQAEAFSDTALVVLGNDGVEASDFTVDQLRLTDEQRDLLDVVTGSFDDVIVVINSGNTMELGFLDEYPEITGALWIGTPGPQGAVSLAQILDGEVNPSGHLTDTYAYDVSSAPGVENFGDYGYDNVNRSLIEYEEGIYLGYRYYETRYAGDEAGYADAVQYPFGHGLSYTSFEWDAAEPVVTDDEVRIEVTVTNTGDVAGKDVVQVYFQPPYTEGGIEKSAIELAAYDKTTLLEPGRSETLSLAFDVRDMSSWSTDLGAYVLEAGTYGIQVSTNVHAPVASFETEIADEVVYETDATTGTAYESRFADAEGGDLEYLSRDDWEGTWPDSSDVATEASDELIAAMFPEFDAVEGEVPTTGADNGLVLADLVGLEYDDPQWDAFLDQLTLEEQTEIFGTGGYMTAGVERLGIPEAVLLDGPAGISFFFGDITAAAFPTEVVIASTWNDDLAYAMGEAVGTEANAYGVQGWYAPGMNLHRTPLGGRNFEYFSEDPLVSGKMGAAMVAGAESRGVITFMKHFALNEQETNARSGVHVWADEQAIRELYLRPFEITVTEGGASGAMSSFIHIGPTWSGGNEALLQDVLRGEWGFDGLVSTDAVLGAFMDPAQAVRNGNDLMLAVLPNSVESAIAGELEADPVGVGEALRDRVHAVLFAVAQTDAVS